MDPKDNTNTDSTPNEQPSGAVEINNTNDAAPEMPETPEAPEAPAAPEAVESDAPKPASIDDDPNITIDSSDEPPQDMDAPKALDVEPAAPMPGSIGSATSGPADAPVNQPADQPADQPAPVTPVFDTPAAAPVPDQPLPMATAPNKSHRSTTILSVVLIGVLLIACVILAVMLVQANQKANQASKAPAPTTSTKSLETVVCTADVTAKYTESVQSVKKVQNTRSFYYEDQKFSRLEDSTQYTFEDAATATAKTEELKSAYTTRYTSAGLAQDPFSSNFSVSEATVKVSHDASADNLNAKNAGILDLTADSDDSIDVEQNSIKKVLEAKGYICAIGSTSTTTSNQ